MVARWEALEEIVIAEGRAGGVDFHEAPSFPRYEAAEAEIVRAEPSSVAGIAAQLRAAARIMDFTNRDATTSEQMLAASLRAAERLSEA